MKAWEIVFGWNDGKNEPLQDGTYYVATLYEGYERSQEIVISTFDYTVEYGWNTTAGSHDHAIAIAHKYWWTPEVRIKPGEIIDLERPDQEGRS